VKKNEEAATLEEEAHACREPVSEKKAQQGAHCFSAPFYFWRCAFLGHRGARSSASLPWACRAALVFLKRSALQFHGGRSAVEYSEDRNAGLPHAEERSGPPTSATIRGPPKVLNEFVCLKDFRGGAIERGVRLLV
jgi:hypothetical protein